MNSISNLCGAGYGAKYPSTWSEKATRLLTKVLLFLEKAHRSLDPIDKIFDPFVAICLAVVFHTYGPSEPEGALSLIHPLVTIIMRFPEVYTGACVWLRSELFLTKIEIHTSTSPSARLIIICVKKCVGPSKCGSQKILPEYFFWSSSEEHDHDAPFQSPLYDTNKIRGSGEITDKEVTTIPFDKLADLTKLSIALRNTFHCRMKEHFDTISG